MTLASNCSLSAAADVAAADTLTCAAHPALRESPADLRHHEIMGRRGERLGTMEFDISRDGDRPGRAKQHEFKLDFCGELARLTAWGADRRWLAPAAPEFRVIVSDRYRISKSLAPAWSGHAGHMEFPAWRVIARKAAILHELVHVFFPNGNRLLAEGLAVYLQAEIGGNPAFPNFGRPLHELAHERLRDMTPGYSQQGPASLEPVDLADLDAIATPSPLTLKVGNDFYGEEPRGQAHLYPLAGSFVQHLIEARGLPAFRALYERTPLKPLHQDAGSPGRWLDAYEMPLSELESGWKSTIAGKAN